MQPDALFPIVNMIALAGWLVLLAGPFWPVATDRIAGLVIPFLLSIAYAGLILTFWMQAEGGFGTLEAVSQLFQTRGMLLAGWIHYLAFDLFVGAWIARTARGEGVPFALVVPCLALTFLFGPVGYLLFQGVRFARGRSTPVSV